LIVDQLSQILRNTLGLKERTPNPGWLKQYQPDTQDNSQNQFAIFLKPETTALQEGVKFEEILNCVLESLRKWKVQVGAIRILTPEYLVRHQIMDRHYGVINQISRHGYHAISERARALLNDNFADDLEPDAEILGGHQFLSRFPAFSAFALSTFSDNVEVKKLTGGTYCVRIKIDGRVFLVLNAFHPHQLERFTTGNKAIVVMEGRSSTPWIDLRREMIGATNPAYAFQGSIRHTLYSHREEFGLANVGQSANGIHLSAGPLEGMVELQRFLSNPDENVQLDFEKTSFGRLLLSKGASREAINSFAGNLNMQFEGHVISAFDLTEELDAEEAADRLMRTEDKIVGLHGIT
jgi:Nucleoside diphosphate kinase.